MREGWSSATLGEIAEYQNGFPFKPADLGETGVPVVRIKQLLDPKEPFDRTEVDVPARNRIDSGDLIFSWSGTLAVRIWDRGPAYLNQHLFSVCEKEGVDRQWLALVLDHALLELGTKTHGTTMRHLTKKDLLPHPIMLPPLDEQRRTADLVRHIERTGADAGSVAEAAEGSWAALVRTVSADSPLVPLGKLVRRARAGGTPSRNQPELFGGGIPWLKSGEMSHSQIVRTEETITDAGLNTSSAWLVPAGTVVVAMYGATAGAVGQLGKEMATNQAVLALETDEKRLSPRWAFHALRSMTAIMKAQAVGAAQPNLSKERVLALEVPCPRLSTQASVVRVLDSLLQVKDRARRKADTLVELRAALVFDLLSGNHEIPASYDSLLVRVA